MTPHTPFGLAERAVPGEGARRRAFAGHHEAGRLGRGRPAELYPAPVRGTGQGFTYNFRRGVGALFPAGIGFAAQTMGVGGAMVFAAAAYGIAVLALFGLPETVGHELK